MALILPAKLSEVNNLSDARYAAGMGMHMVGFMMDEEVAGYVKPNQVNEITGWLAGIEIVAEFETSYASTIEKVLAESNVDFVQFTDPSLILQLPEKPRRILKFCVNRPDMSEEQRIMEKYKDEVDYFLLECGSGTEERELIHEEEEKQLTDLCSRYPIILGYGFSDTTVRDFVKAIKPKAIAIKGGTEIRPGYKDYDEMAYILENLEDEE